MRVSIYVCNLEQRTRRTKSASGFIALSIVSLSLFRRVVTKLTFVIATSTLIILMVIVIIFSYFQTIAHNYEKFLITGIDFFCNATLTKLMTIIQGDSISG